MNNPTGPVGSRPSWFLPHTSRTVDTVGVAVAMVFLVVIAMFAGGRGEKAAEKNGWQEESALAISVNIRPLSKAALESGTAASAQVMTGLRKELEDPRRGN
jgi:hypothetical protein